MEPVTEDIPEEFTCPISQDLMHDPVRIDDGTFRCFDRAHIQQWFDRCGANPTSPLTRAIVSPDLIEAPDMKARIDARFNAPSAPPLAGGWENPSSAPMGYDAAARGMRLFPVEMPTPSAPPLAAGRARPTDTAIPQVPAEALNTDLPAPVAAGPAGATAPQAHAGAQNTGLPSPLPSEPQAVGATAKDFANVSALARRDLRGAIKKHGTPWLSSVAAATLGAAGGIMVGGAVAGGFALGTLLAPCVAIAAGLTLVGAGATVGMWLRQRLTHKSQQEPHVTEKVTALTEMRSAFEGLEHRNKAEEQALTHVKTALGEFNAGKSLRHHFAWAAGAAALAMPVGVAAGLFVAAKLRDNREDKAKDKAGVFATPPAAASAMPPTQRHVHTHYHVPLFPDASWGMQSIWRLQDYASHRPAAAPPMPERNSVRVAMQPHWLKALDPHSYARLCDAQGIRA